MNTKTAKEKSWGWQTLEKLPKGSTIYTILKRVSRSGMTRILDIVIIDDGEPRRVIVQEKSTCAKNVDQMDKWRGNYKVCGCGMDMGFWLVYKLGSLIHNDGYYFKQSWL